MTEQNDNELLQEYARTQSEAAFAIIVERHINLVYSAALRFANNPSHAEEITQAVFVILTRKAASLRRNTLLSGWLYQTARLTSANFVKSEIRRQRREQEAYMQSTLNAEESSAAWEQLAPFLDEAMGHLGEIDRNAVVLRFFENKTNQEVAEALNLKSAAIHMRVTRALEKLRKFLVKRNITLSASLIAGAMAANSVQAAPVGLAVTVTATAAKGSAVGGSTLTLIKGVLKVMAWTKAKTAIAVGASVLLAAGTTTVVIEKMRGPTITDDMWVRTLKNLTNLPPVLILRPTHFSTSIPRDSGGVISFEGAIYRYVEFYTLFYHAYGKNKQRTANYGLLPDSGKQYDLMLTLKNQPIEALRNEIKKQFRLTAHREMRTTNVLILQKSAHQRGGLKEHVGEESFARQEGSKYVIKNYNMDQLGDFLEDWMDVPVINRTGIEGRCDMEFPMDNAVSLVTSRTLVKNALIDDLGLELVPSTEEIEMLVVEKVK